MRIVEVLATSGGGVGRHVADLAAGLAAAGHDVRVAGPAATDAAFRFGAGFVPVDISDRPRPRADLAALRRLRGLAAGADVLHAHGLRAGALAALAVRSVRRRPALVVTLHNALVSGGRIAAVHAVLERVVARGADVVLTVSDDLGAAIRARGARDVRHALVPAPPLPPATRPAAAVRRELGVPGGGALLVTVARLAPQKGLPHLADAVARLARPGLVAAVAGDGPLEAELRGTGLTLLGRRADVADLLAAADLVVVPSLWEGQPLVVQEALRAGAAVVATDAGGTAAVAGGAAALVRPGDPAALAAAIARLLDDPAETAALRVRAHERAARLPTAANATQQVTAVYEDAIATLRARAAERPRGPGTASD